MIFATLFLGVAVKASLGGLSLSGKRVQRGLIRIDYGQTVYLSYILGFYKTSQIIGFFCQLLGIAGILRVDRYYKIVASFIKPEFYRLQRKGGVLRQQFLACDFVCYLVAFGFGIDAFVIANYQIVEICLGGGLDGFNAVFTQYCLA